MIQNRNRQSCSYHGVMGLHICILQHVDIFLSVKFSANFGQIPQNIIQFIENGLPNGPNAAKLCANIMRNLGLGGGGRGGVCDWSTIVLYI